MLRSLALANNGMQPMPQSGAADAERYAAEPAFEIALD